MILEKGSRADGRGPADIRPITCEVSALPRTHGSAIFTRGETQSLAVVTLGTTDDEQRIDALEGEYMRTFMLHYNFPPFSVGEARPLRSPGRREVGHGALAERALAPVVPSKEAFPYTLRIVSDILESNGSSSMATVCGGSLAMMDAGVPIREAVAGIAMGLIKEGDRVMILSDILGLEDHLGDMDFKVCGTKQGVTALQMDIKIGGITSALMQKALEQAKAGRLHILSCMEKALQAPRTTLSTYAPRIFTMKVKQDKIREIIGPGGKTIRGIIADCGVKINVDDSGTVTIASVDGASAEKAKEMISRITEEVEIGKIYMGTVRKIMDFRRVCRGPAGNRRTGAHLAAGAPSSPSGVRRGEGRRSNPGEGPGSGSARKDPPQSQGSHAGSDRGRCSGSVRQVTVLYRKFVLDNGVRVVTERMPTLKSVTVGVWVNTGSRDEQYSQAGYSHFIEHMLFKGTSKRSSVEISREIDALGGEMNAFTSRETTTYYVKVLDQQLQRAVELLSDLFHHSCFAPKEIEKEKQVVLEEIRMVRDDPEDLVQELHIGPSARTPSARSPYSGSREDYQRSATSGSANYIETHYDPGQTVVSIAGNFDQAHLDPMVTRYFGKGRGAKASLANGRQPPDVHGGVLLKKKRLEQVHLCLGIKGMAAGHQDRYALYALNSVLGGSVSSRLFQEVREKRGLVYSIYSFLSGYSDGGMITVYAATRPKEVDRVVDLVCREIRQIGIKGVERKELETGKDPDEG